MTSVYYYDNGDYYSTTTYSVLNISDAQKLNVTVHLTYTTVHLNLRIVVISA